MKTFKQILRIIFFPLIGIMIWYIPMSFYLLELNPTKWDASDRLLFSAEGMLFLLVGLGVALFANHNDK